MPSKHIKVAPLLSRLHESEGEYIRDTVNQKVHELYTLMETFGISHIGLHVTDLEHEKGIISTYVRYNNYENKNGWKRTFAMAWDEIQEQIKSEEAITSKQENSDV